MVTGHEDKETWLHY